VGVQLGSAVPWVMKHLRSKATKTHVSVVPKQRCGPAAPQDGRTDGPKDHSISIPIRDYHFCARRGSKFLLVM
jgi:hypothetical protein